ncbi:MAG: hypothetical protein ACK5JF_13170 [Oscillospiraceae bacterium]
MDEVWAELGFCASFCDLLVAYLLRSEEWADYVEPFFTQDPAIGEIMEEEENRTILLQSIADGLNGSSDVAKQRRDALVNDKDNFVGKALAVAFAVFFNLQPDAAEQTAAKYIEIYKTGSVPTYAQIVNS